MQHAIDPSPGPTSQAQPMKQPPRTLRLLLLKPLRSVSVSHLLLTDHPHLVLVVVSMFLSPLNPTCPVFFLHPRDLTCVAQVEILFFVYSPINFLLVETQRCVLLGKHKNNSNCRREPFFPVITQRAIVMVAFGWTSRLIPNSSILYSTTVFDGATEVFIRLNISP